VTGRATRISLAVWSVAVIAFLWIPIVLIGVYALNSSNIQGWPNTSWTFHWVSVAWHSQEARDAFRLSVEVALIATAIALILGTMAAAAVARFKFFGREAVSFLLVLPLALPGILTGIALSSTYTFIGMTLSIWTIVIGHATFCVVIVYNNVVARLRRTSPSLIEASQDLGADGWQTFRFVVWPVLSTALVAGGLLAFALSFDEVIVTVFTSGAQETLPIFIFNNIQRGQQLPIVNVVAVFVILVTVIPIAFAQRMIRDTGVLGRGAANVTEAVEAAEIPAA
jgi:putative spermidine/putrescine transport system permease protein